MHGATDRQLPLECYDLVAVLGYPITLYDSLHYYKDGGAWSRRGGGGGMIAIMWLSLGQTT